MAFFDLQRCNLEEKDMMISIQQWEKINDHVVRMSRKWRRDYHHIMWLFQFKEYVINVRLGNASWTANRRYREFADYDRQRFKKLKESLLPPKKSIGNTNEQFVEKRWKELESYLRTVFELEILLQRRLNQYSLPKSLATFLAFDSYVR